MQNTGSVACYVRKLDNSTIGANGYGPWTPGANWQAQGTGDCNGDGKRDILLQNANDGQCYIWEMVGINLIGSGAGPWIPGAEWKAQATGDYNGDGKSDIMLQNSTSGQCYLWRMDVQVALGKMTVTNES